MTFSAGEQLGTYEILGSLGAVGMGEVYRARDTRLKRSRFVMNSAAPENAGSPLTVILNSKPKL
jgi:hypothetical protein